MLELTSEEWIKKLGRKLDDQIKEVQTYRDYYEGKHKLAFATADFQSAFGGLFAEFSDNFCDVPVDVLGERLDVDGFRMGAEGDAEADKDAWRIWQANNLDAYSKLAHQASLVEAMAFAVVWNNPDDETIPLVSIEDSSSMAVMFDRGNPRRKLAALKRWRDESGYLYATLYLPDRIEKYQSTNKIQTTTNLAWATGRPWVAREGVEFSLDNPLGEVPAVAFVNRPRLDGSGRSEIKGVIPLQDAINKMVTNMMVSSEFAAFIQRWATGVEIPLDPETNKPVESFKASVMRLWQTPNENAHFGEFSQHDPKAFIGPVEMFVQHIATQTRVPPHYFLASMGNFPSGESLKSAETGLVARLEDKKTGFGESWEEVIRLGFKVLGDPRGDIMDSQTIWRDTESRTEAEHMDALLKRAALGIPLEAIWEDAGYTPQQIERFKTMLRDGAPTLQTLTKDPPNITAA